VEKFDSLNENPAYIQFFQLICVPSATLKTNYSFSYNERDLKPAYEISYYGDKMDRDITHENNLENEPKMSRNVTLNESPEKDVILDSNFPCLQDISFPKTDNVLHLILNTLNQDIATFYTFVKFAPYIPEDQFNAEILKRSMGIHRNFAILFLLTKGELVFIYSEFLESIERLLFKGQECHDYIKYTHKLCGAINDYKIALQREGYLPNPRKESLLGNI
jgi:hypothetical protein